MEILSKEHSFRLREQVVRDRNELCSINRKKARVAGDH